MSLNVVEYDEKLHSTLEEYLQNYELHSRESSPCLNLKIRQPSDSLSSSDHIIYNSDSAFGVFRDSYISKHPEESYAVSRYSADVNSDTFYFGDISFTQNYNHQAFASSNKREDSINLQECVGDNGSIFEPSTIRRLSMRRKSSTSNRKERRRTHSINAAFSALRNCIPNVPSDTKLSKIKTLRLATSYIAFLINVLDKNDPKLVEAGFKADMSSRRNENRDEKRRREAQEILKVSERVCDKPSKGRTGWPQQVWASELK